MKYGYAIALLSIAFCAQGQYRFSDFSRLHSLQGVWQMKTSKGLLIEQWTRISDSVLTGKSFQVKGQDSSMPETVILKYSNGTITYTPTVPDQNQGREVTFTLVGANAASGYIFENKQHDYPQQIIYCIEGKNLKVHLRAMSDRAGQERQFIFSKQHD